LKGGKKEKHSPTVFKEKNSEEKRDDHQKSIFEGVFVEGNYGRYNPESREEKQKERNRTKVCKGDMGKRWEVGPIPGVGKRRERTS